MPWSNDWRYFLSNSTSRFGRTLLALDIVDRTINQTNSGLNCVSFMYPKLCPLTTLRLYKTSITTLSSVHRKRSKTIPQPIDIFFAHWETLLSSYPTLHLTVLIAQYPSANTCNPNAIHAHTYTPLPLYRCLSLLNCPSSLLGNPPTRSAFLNTSRPFSPSRSASGNPHHSR